MYLIFDTETTGLPKKWNAPITDTNNWPRCVQIAWQIHDELGKCISHQDYLINPEGFNIPYDAEQIHGISTELAQKQGFPLAEVLEIFNKDLAQTKFIVGQNLGFDINIMGCEFHRMGIETPLNNLPILDTCTEDTARMCQLPGGRGGKFKLPTLTELHAFLFGEPFAEAHNATADVEATARCFFELIRIGQFTTSQLQAPVDYHSKYKEANPDVIGLIGLKHVNLKKESNQLKQQIAAVDLDVTVTDDATFKLDTVPFSHLHNHSQFSILQSTSSINNLINTAVKFNMPAVALTDIGNMMGAFNFVSAITKHNTSVEKANKNLEENQKPQQKIKGIVGCVFNVCENYKDRTHKDNGYQMVLLAKNKQGYYNLAKMASMAYTEGFYYVPRIDRAVLKQYKEDIIVLSGDLRGEISSKILNIGEQQAEDALLWWHDTFKDDFYIELIRHNQENEDHVNKVLIDFSKKYTIKVVATNTTFYIDKDDAESHDILLCVKDNEKKETPKGRGRGYRFGLPNSDYYFKSPDEMKALFKDIPEAIENIQEIVAKVEPFTLARKVLLPKFNIPEAFKDVKDEEDGGKRGENSYLKHLAFLGAEKRYPNIDDATKERIDFELSIIEMTGYPGYFLIVEDLIKKAREMGVSVGPGRGSAAGSVVAYCLKITNIDPLKYNLLFERFLNPDRVSLPDIDIDFDDEGRQSVINYVIDKYGANQVAQIITYGTMAAKSAVRDTARVLDLPLQDADRLAKMIPGIKLQNIFGDDDKSKAKRGGLKAEEQESVKKLIAIAEGDTPDAKTLNQAKAIEGTVRNTGVHACGIIISPENISNLVPVARAKDSDMVVTQFDNHVVENAGLLKMDFLGLKTLTLIKDVVKIVEAIHHKTLVPDDFPLDDEKTFELFQRGETVGIFQYESPGMQKNLKALKPTEFADLIAMNALYRPGPMDYIPLFIQRKHGEEVIEYDLPIMEEILKETYGVTVYQEQVMLLSQKIANFTKGEADKLRKGMGKKILSILKELKPKFFEGGKANGHPEEVLEKIWKDWEKFAEYAFNKSHSTCYAFIAYQTAYLKAHYPAEFMAACLSNNMNDIKQVGFFMEECKRSGLAVLGPDVNESFLKFSVNKEGAIRFGMAAIKGVGANAVKAIVKERKENGNFHSIFDIAKRIDLRAANKKVFDGLILAGALDSLDNTVNRSQYFALDEKNQTFIEKAIRFGNKYQENKNAAQVSLFGESSDVQFEEPKFPFCEPWGMMEKLAKEKEVIGMYISGHPLDDYKIEINNFCNASVKYFNNQDKLIGKELTIAGIVTNVQHRISKNGKGWASFVVEDFTDTFEFRMFSESYLKFKHFLVPNSFLHFKVKVEKGWQEGQTILKFVEIKMLQNIMTDLTKKITLNVELKSLNEAYIKDINKLLKAHKGDKRVSFEIKDNAAKIKLKMHSQTFKIKMSKEFLEDLEKHQINFNLN
ncbi:MAG: DNA polymerase III subunit alpha [Flavobacteriaceae bacterium]